MVISDAAGVITLANQQASRLFGYSSDEFIGMPVDGLMGVDCTERVDSGSP